MIWQSIKMAWNTITSNKMRSLLTMLGIIIGVVALVVLVSLVSGASDSVTEQINSLGSNMFSVSVIDDKGDPLRIEDITEISDMEEIAAAAPAASSSMTAKYHSTEASASVYGTTAQYMDIQNIELLYGRFLKTADLENNTYVCVLSYEAADELCGTTKGIVGDTVKLNGRDFTIVGVLDEDDSALTSLMGTLNVYIPYTVLTRVADTVSLNISTFIASPSDTESMDAADAALERYLLDRFNNDDEAFLLANTSMVMDAMSSVTDILSILLGGIAAISLLVGGIGIMNIMLVSVTERTREIGIRKAIGAGRGSILGQFLLEALMLSLIGCVIGILLSWGILGIVSIFAGDTMSFSLSFGVVLVAVLFSTIIGVAFGIYPAAKAANKPPIEALRYSG